MARRRLKDLLAEPAVPGLLRGEIWINPEVWEQAGFGHGPQGRVAFSRELGADLCCFPWPLEGYREEASCLTALCHGQGLECGLVIDGPFQRLAGRRDLCALLAEKAGTPRRFAAHLDQEKARLLTLLDGLAEAPVDLLLIGEDVGYAQGLYFAPDRFRELLLPFYGELLDRFRGEGLAWGWHSDGKVEPLLPDLVACGFQCFSLEPEAVDLLAFKKRHGSRICLLGGIRAEWLAANPFDRTREEASLREIGALVREGGMILASACGLHHPSFLPNLKRLYQLIPPFRL